MRISRRKFLGGAGAVVALPALEVFTGSVAHAQTVAPKRLLFYYVPNGIHMRAWTPTATGEGFAFTPILKPLESLRSKITVLSGLDNNAASSQGDGFGDHARGTGSFITATHVRKTSGSDIENGISVDQLAAQRVGAATRFRSLELGISGGASTGGCDSGYSCAYTRNISWSGPRTPVAKEINARSVFDRLFAGFETPATNEQVQKRYQYKKSILDFVLADTTQLAGTLGRGDREKLDEYLSGIRELEVRLERDAAQSEQPDPQSCNPGSPPSTGGTYTQSLDRMADLMVLAMQCDATRFISFMAENGGSERAFRDIGISEGHHTLSHHQGSADKLGKLEKINTFEVQRLAYLLGKMNAITEANGLTLLDNSLVFFSSDISDGDSHSHFDMPVVLAGRAGGAVRAGRHLKFSGTTSVGKLFVSMLATVGVNVSRFGDDGEGPLSGLT